MSIINLLTAEDACSIWDFRVTYMTLLLCSIRYIHVIIMVASGAEREQSDSFRLGIHT